jgi:hypothetical protein
MCRGTVRPSIHRPPFPDSESLMDGGHWPRVPLENWTSVNPLVERRKTDASGLGEFFCFLTLHAVRCPHECPTRGTSLARLSPLYYNSPSRGLRHAATAQNAARLGFTAAEEVLD